MPSIAPLAGVKVIEVANFLAVPLAGAMMADLGADVVKVEPLAGDPGRYAFIKDKEFDYNFPTKYPFELTNRGKRSITLDLEHQESLEVLSAAAGMADVFITNLLPQRLKRYRLTYQDLCPNNPRLVYLAFSAYGDQGPDQNRPGFDQTAFWARSGMMSSFGRPGEVPVQPPPGTGDHMTAPLLLAGILTALLLRERTGRGQEVGVSLFNSGLWALGSDLQDSLVARRQPKRHPRSQAPNPLRNSYRTSDGRWLIIQMVHTDANWEKCCAALGRPDLLSHPKFRSLEARRNSARAVVKELEKTIGSTSQGELGPRLDKYGVVWAPVQGLEEVIDDPQAKSNGYFTRVEHPSYGWYQTLNFPIKFSDSPAGPKGCAPEVGQHTEEVLLELGFSWERIETLKRIGAIV